MKLNEFTYCVSESLVLVPYEAYHVPKYHQWMMQLDLLEATGSEPLSLEEEFDMQQNWRNSDDKLTFIVLHRPTLESIIGSVVPDAKSPDALPWQRQPEAEINSMIGDVNAFVIAAEAETDEADAKEFELEVMIAEDVHRGRGLGRQAVQCLIAYLSEALKARPDQLLAKINDNNFTSQRMFTGPGLEFSLASRQAVFQQATYRCPTARLPPRPAGWCVLNCAAPPL